MAYASWSVTFGEQPSAAKWNILGTNDASFNDGTGIAGLLVNNLTTYSNPYKFSVYRNAAWTSATNAYGKVTFDTEEFDTNGNFASGTYTAPVTGLYFFSWTVGATVTSGGAYETSLFKGGVQFKAGSGQVQGAASVGARSTGSVLTSVTATNTFEIHFYGTGGAGATGAVASHFEGFLVCKT